MWRFEIVSVAPMTLRCSVMTAAGPLTFRQVLELWSDSEGFCAEWMETLAAIPFGGYCFETPPLNQAEVDRPFQCVFVANESLAMAVPDPRPFSEFIGVSGSPSAVSFRSLGGDAVLIAPKAGADGRQYAHLATFVRQADRSENHALWRTVSEAFRACMGQDWLWLNTAGMGVSWLHVRIDTRPKYYRHRVYADSAFWTHSVPG